MAFEVKTADELVDPELEARWSERREARRGALLRCVLRAFVEHGGAVSVAEIERALPDWPSARVREELAVLDASDLLLLQEYELRLAYPFSAEATPFIVRFKDGRERYACCAVDALGVAAMLRERITIRSRCHDCGEPLELSADADGPIGADSAMVWVAQRRVDERRVCASLWTLLNFFRSEEHVRAWYRAHPDTGGAATHVAEAFKLAARIFGGLMDEG